MKLVFFTLVISTLFGCINEAVSQIVYEPYTFTTLAGLASVSGTNDGAGSAARFFQPEGVAADYVGNIYVCDSWNNTIRKITADGMVTTVAGIAGIQGTNDGTGYVAMFNRPWGVALDKADNIYIADLGGQTIRKITPVGTNWIVSTLAGNINHIGNNDGIGSAARFDSPKRVAVDIATNLYVADANGIRKVTPDGTVTTIVPNASAVDIAVDAATNLYIARPSNNTIGKITLIGTNWVTTTLAGTAGSIFSSADGVGTAAKFNGPTGITVDTNGNVYVVEEINRTVRKITTNGVVTTLAGWPGYNGTNDGTGITARFNYIEGVTSDRNGNLYVTDILNQTIKKGHAENEPAVIIASGTNFGFRTNHFGFNLTTLAGQWAVVEVSTNLVKWSSIWTNSVFTNILSFVDTQNATSSECFYRVRTP